MVLGFKLCKNIVKPQLNCKKKKKKSRLWTILNIVNPPPMSVLFTGKQGSSVSAPVFVL